MYLASVVLTQSSVQRQFLKQIKHSLRLGGCCPFFLLLLLHQLWRPYSCRRIGSETCSHWKLTLKEDLCLRASTCIKKGTEIGGWRRVEFGTDFSQHCTVKQAQTGCEIAEQMGSVKWYFSKAPSNFQLFFFFFPADLLCSSYTNNCISTRKDVLSCGTKICCHKATVETVSFLTWIAAIENFHSVIWHDKKVGSCPSKEIHTLKSLNEWFSKHCPSL